MEFLTDLKSRLSLRSNAKRSSDVPLWSQLTNGDEFLVLEIDRSGLIRGANAELCKARGSELDEILGTSLLYLMSADDRSELSQLVSGIFSGRPEGSAVARLLTNGETAPTVRWSLFPIPNEEGEIKAAICIGADLTPYLDDTERGESANRELTELRQALAEQRRETQALQQELDRRTAAAEREKDAAAAAALQAENYGPIPGLEDEGTEPAVSLAQLERRYIVHTLEETGWRVSGAKGAAARLGLHANTLRSRMEKYGIEKKSLVIGQ